MVLRDEAGHVVDSLNYGGLVDPWASGRFLGAAGKSATCHADAPGIPSAHTGPRPLPGIPFSGLVARVDPTQGSTGRYPDGQDSDHDCSDFVTSESARIAATATGASRVKTASVGHFAPGQAVVIDVGDDAETLTVASVGSSGLTGSAAPSEKGDTTIRVEDARLFAVGQAIIIGSGANEENGVVAAVDTRRGAGKLTLAQPLQFAHDAGGSVSGTGIAFTTGLARPHAAGTLMTSVADLATPGAPNRYGRRGPGL
jgi:hypothetical protein